MFGFEPDTGLDSLTLGSRPELKSIVGCSTSWATQVPHHNFKNLNIFKHACRYGQHTNTLSVYPGQGICFLTYSPYSCHRSLTLKLHKNRFSVRSNLPLHYEFRKCSSNIYEGAKICATKPQMDRLRFIFSSSVNLPPGRGADEQWNDHMLNAARNTKREKRNQHSLLLKLQVFPRL